MVCEFCKNETGVKCLTQNNRHLKNVKYFCFKLQILKES